MRHYVLSNCLGTNICPRCLHGTIPAFIDGQVKVGADLR